MVAQGSPAILAWLICEVVPRFQQSTDKPVPLETTVQSLFERASRLEEDVASLGASSTATHALNTMLADDLRALKQKVKENHEGMEFHQPISQGEELSARIQALESQMEELKPPISMLSDASESSTCTLTPASTVVIDSNDERADFEHTEAATVALIHLNVAVYTGDPIGCLSGGRSPIQRLIVKMHPHTPFKILTDKLLEKFCDRQLYLNRIPYHSVFDSDTPASLQLEDHAALAYANVAYSAKTMDLTIL